MTLLSTDSSTCCRPSLQRMAGRENNASSKPRNCHSQSPQLRSRGGGNAASSQPQSSAVDFTDISLQSTVFTEIQYEAGNRDRNLSENGFIYSRSLRTANSLVHSLMEIVQKYQTIYVFFSNYSSNSVEQRSWWYSVVNQKCVLFIC